MTSRVLHAFDFVPACVLVGLLAAPTTATAGDGLAPAGDVGAANPNARIEENVGGQLPLDLELRDEKDQPITLRQCIDGKPTILVPMYYRCPIICDVVLGNLVETVRNMPQNFSVGDKFNVVAVSIDPFEHGDRASEKKKAVLERYGRVGAENGWHFLTGKKEAVAELMSTLGFRYEFDKSIKEYNHPTGIVTVTPEGKIARYFYGIKYDGKFGIPGGQTTLEQSLDEAKNGKIGSLLDKTLFALGCYRYDHIKGYSLNVLRTVQIGGVLTLLIVGTWLFFTFRRGGAGRRTANIDGGAGIPPAPELSAAGTAAPQGPRETPQ